MEEENRRELLIKVAKLYYEEKLSQGEISKIINLSRSYVSKLIAAAETEGIVSIKVHDSNNTESSLERKVRTRFNLIRVFAIYSRIGEDYQNRVASFAADYFPSLLHSGDTVAVDCGNTLYKCAYNMKTHPELENISVVGIRGGYTDLSNPTFSQQIPTLMANALNGIGYDFPCPAVIQNTKLKQALFQEPSLQKVLDLRENADMVLFTVDGMSMGSSSNIVNSMYVSPDELDEIGRNGAIGSICNHYLDKDGNLCTPALDEKVTSMSLQALKKVKYRICIATGRSKYRTVYSALKGGYINILIVDQDMAKALTIMTD